MDIVKNQKISINNCKSNRINNVSYIDCEFSNIVLSDIIVKDVSFSNCTFNRVIIEKSSLTNVRITQSKILSLIVRGEREISKNRLLGKRIKGLMKNVNLDGSNVINDIQFSKNLLFDCCSFPKSSNSAHIIAPYEIYTEALTTIRKDWNDRKQEIGIREIQAFYLGKSVEKQNEDFITYQENVHLDEETNTIIKDVFKLIKSLSIANPIA